MEGNLETVPRTWSQIGSLGQDQFSALNNTFSINSKRLNSAGTSYIILQLGCEHNVTPASRKSKLIEISWWQEGEAGS
uniref:Uncharacterized protein n=1 Tax=Ditylenchus dipsaci TaxID=166011 RepID=A0A915CRF3_9BILA